jgi:hypothetical protein
MYSLQEIIRYLVHLLNNRSPGWGSFPPLVHYCVKDCKVENIFVNPFYAEVKAQIKMVNCREVFAYIAVVSIEPTVRAELMEQVPHIALFCQENRPSIPYAFSKYLLPIVVRYLADQNNQVRVPFSCS